MSKIIVSLPNPFLEVIDRIAKEEHRSRSELLREAFRVYIGIKKDSQSISLLEKPKVKKALSIQQKSKKRLKEIKWNSTVEIRRWRGEI
jgi:metal-responsive CopG/Arc/MetJ family transcriptional regulator